MGASDKKQFISIQGKPVLFRSAQLFTQIPQIKEIVVVTNEEDIVRTEQMLADIAPLRVIAGGAERQQSVWYGLKVLKNVEFVLIHDAARPFPSRKLIEKIMASAREEGGAVPAVPVKDTIKIVNGEGVVESTPPRQSLWAAQTPQAFRLSTILTAHQQAQDKGFVGTDDSMLMEWQGHRVVLVEGEYTNIKLTTPEDLKLGETILEQRRG
ncbi:2-C-methyl-D-erythritol 4-phosphate cytidylyltransferase [Ammoniphilus oxalaticus]|uniref:2-C-methyl-D-erythritol 4-phosphate cytidylyltransferase n=2 Tax=Ammoniphilus oxalaticus TaxID=66863 RepID=A0A419SHE9_9BACL|nr:2-C-methyl-D-erythritol 4-phosphate cytidylyltransferase [Ammoniphilus oxalaticus]